jgi:hypothetical protein
MARRSTLRASDSDREQIAERLRHATAEGRLLAEELEQRLEVAFSARTYGELDVLVADLPSSVELRRRSPRPWLLPAIGLMIAIPIALALIAVVLFIVTSLFAVWMVWLVIGWWLFGRHNRRGRYYHGRYPRSMHGHGHWNGGCRHSAQARSPWV